MWAHETVIRLINLRVCSCAHGCSNLQVAGARLIQKFLCTNFIFIQFLVTLAEKKSLSLRAIIVHRILRLLPIRKQRKKMLRLVSDMLNSHRNWKGRYFFVQWMDWVCRREEWVTIPYGFDNTWGIVKDLGLAPSVFSFFFIYSCKCLTLSTFFN